MEEALHVLPSFQEIVNRTDFSSCYLRFRALAVFLVVPRVVSFFIGQTTILLQPFFFVP